MRKVERIILYITLAILIFLGSFFGVTKTASANNDNIVFVINGKTVSPSELFDSDDLIENESEDEEKEDGDEPRLCLICKERECAKGEDYCFECKKSLDSAKIYVDAMMKAEKNKETSKTKESSKNVIDEPIVIKGEVKGPTASDIAFILFAFFVISAFCAGVTRYYFKLSSTGSSGNMYVDYDKESSIFDVFDEEIPKAESVVDTVLTPEDFKDLDNNTKGVDYEKVNESEKTIGPENTNEAEKTIEQEKKNESEKVIETKKVIETEKVLGKKEFLECLKQQTTFYHTDEPFVVGITDSKELYLLDYSPNTFIMVKVSVEDNGKLKVVYDYRRNNDILVGIDYELGKNTLRFRLKSNKGVEADFVLSPVVKANIKGYKIDYDQSKGYGKITNEYLAGYIIWIQNNADFCQGMNKELSNQELKEKVKNLDPTERNKFVELAKNGKTNDAIKVCREVTGLGLKEAKRVIEYKLYY